jgi:hypothetical protein
MTLWLALLWMACWAPCGRAQDILDDLSILSSQGDRSTGSPGAENAANYILKRFTEAGLSEVGSQEFLQPIPEVSAASIEIAGESTALFPWGPNLAYLPMTPPEGLSGPLIYASDGQLQRFDGQPAQGAIVVMDMDSQNYWMNAYMLGASAVIFLGDPKAIRNEFDQKNIPTPLTFPRYYAPPEEAVKLKLLAAVQSGTRATVKSQTRWRNKMVSNCYGLLLGKSKALKEELVVLEAFYDASSYVLGRAPGADEATSIAMLLTLVGKLAQDPPERSVLFVATVGNGQGLAGMREFIWAATGRKKSMKDQEKAIGARKKTVDHLEDLLSTPDPLALENPEDRDLVWQLIVDRAKDVADRLIREIQYQKALAPKDAEFPAEGPSSTELEKSRGDLLAPDASSTGKSAGAFDQAAALPPAVVEDPREYRRLSWHTGNQPLSPDERALAIKLLKGAKADLKAEKAELKQRLRAIKSSLTVRSVLGDYTPVLFMSLYLSSHSPVTGLTEMGDTYPLREPVKRQIRAFRLNEALTQISAEVARAMGIADPVVNTSRGAVSGAGLGNPPAVTCTCCDVAALADLPAVSLATLEDHRSLWSTPNDTLDHVDRNNVATLARFLPPVMTRLFSRPNLGGACESGIRGFASVNGQAMFMRQGELFADQPAPGTIISAIQGNSVFRTMVNRDGSFHLPGVANKRVAFEKVLLEPYGLDPVTGRVAWTADKKETDKANYRVKVKGDVATITLTMFHCEQTDVVNIFDPRRLDYLTKVQLLDASTGATPLRYWYSRVDGRDTNAVSIFLEKGTRFKLIMADTLLHKQLLLLNSTAQHPMGQGFLIGDPPSIDFAPYRVGQDVRLLLGERLENLHERGIVNHYLEDLYARSNGQLEAAHQDATQGRFAQFWDQVIAAWAKLEVIYNEVESTQRDVLTGVLFFIALFVPFAYCMERYLFCFRGVYQQIAAFFLILLITIFTIKSLHPAFQLTYSPMVVIIAFFIVGLSLMVSWIIFMRFEHEMADLQRHASHLTAPQVSKWQAFGAGFAIGVSNLNRRKLRTALTCTTLVILTFTVMSFTNVKSFHKTTDTRIADQAPYRGVLLRHQYRKTLLPLVLEDMQTRFAGLATIWPKAWISPESSTDRTLARLYGPQQQSVPLEGLLGVGLDPPPYIRQLVTVGRWFQPGERDVLLLPLSAARRLGLQPEKDVEASVVLWGNPFRVIGYFDENVMETIKDLDQDLITPAYLETNRGEELTEAEVEAAQSGEEIQPLTERFRYANAYATAIMPFATCLDYGGELKTIAILPLPEQDPLALADRLSTWLAFPLFVGDDGTFFHSASATLRYQGVANLLVPILIVIFICLNTLIGHVHERQKEISIYTSVGLAPTHVGFLFIVEALSLAVIATVIGYILAQLTAKTLGHTAAFSQLTFNYSSLASVACMFLVFSVVFVASLYPARLAAEMAMPDVNRSWNLPAPEGDRINMNLPFLLKYEEEKGIMGFLTAFFVSYQDVAHGAFIVDDTNLLLDEINGANGQALPRGEGVCLFLRTNVWLAPFDFGIKQGLLLHCCPSTDNPGYLEISLQMMRVSGEQSAWQRANKNFIKALRKQMLLWRLLDQEAKAHYGQFVPA